MKREQYIQKSLWELKTGKISRREFLGRMMVIGGAVAGAGSLLGATRALAQDQPFAGVEIVTTFMQSGTYDVGALNIEADFEAATGISLEVIASPWAVLNQNHITDLTTGTGEFDVMSGEFWIASVYDKMLLLTAYVERDGFGEGIIEGVWKPGPSGFYGGERIGVPFSADVYGVLYRTDIFEANGIDPNWETWDDFIERMGALQEALAGTEVAPMVFAWGAQEQTASLFLGLYDGYLVNSENVYALDPEKAVAALDTLVSLLQYNPEGASSLSIDEANAVFLAGNAAVLVGWPSFVRAAAQDPDQSTVVDKWATSIFPGPGFPFLSAWNMFISSFSENPDAAWEWIKYYNNAERARERFVELGVGSPWVATYEDAELLEQYSHDFPSHLANLQRAKSVPWVFEAFEILFRNMGEQVIGSMTAAEVVEATNTAWAEITVPQALIEAAEAQGQKQA